MAHTRTGVGQGDPFGSLFFELALQPVLLRLVEVVRQIETEYNADHPAHPVLRPALVCAYEDDTSVRGELEIMSRLAPFIAEIFAESGFRVKPEKSTITGNLTDSMNDPPEDFVVSAEGMKTLGTAIGTRDYQSTTGAEQLDSMAPPTAALTLLSPRSAMLILSHCVNPRPCFVLRTTGHLEDLRHAAKRFDDLTCNCIAAILGIEITEDLKTRIFLPRKLGGLGFTRHDGMSSEKNNLMSRLAFQNFVASVYPQDYRYGQQHNNNPHWRPIRLGTFENLEQHTGLTDDIVASMTHLTGKLALSTGMKTAHLYQSTRLRAALAADPNTRHEAAWLLSSSASTVNFVTSTRGLINPTYFRDEDYICAVRAVLGQGPINNPSAVEYLCECRKRVTPRFEPLHAIGCTNSRSMWKYRHDLIRDLLHALLLKLFPNSAPLTEVLLGQTVPNAQGETQDIVADITLHHQAQHLVIDISVVSPTSNQYMMAGNSPATHQDAASKAQERKKRAHYATLAAPNTPLPAAVIPFVLEASGRLGPTALAFLLRILPTQTFIRSRFIKDVAFICSRSLGHSLRNARDRNRVLPINGVYAPLAG